MVSGLRNKIFSPFASLNASLLAFAKPALAFFQIKCTCENRLAKNGALPSVELLSITMISASIFAQAFITLQRHCSKKYFTL